MVKLLIDTYRTAEHQPGRLRGELTSQEIKKHVAMCLKPGKSTGPDRCPNELTKTMTDEKFQIVKMWVNETLTEDTSRQRATMNGTISQLHGFKKVEARINRWTNEQWSWKIECINC